MNRAGPSPSVTADLPGPAADQNGKFDLLNRKDIATTRKSVPESGALSGGRTGPQILPGRSPISGTVMCPARPRTKAVGVHSPEKALPRPVPFGERRPVLVAGLGTTNRDATSRQCDNAIHALPSIRKESS